MRVCLGRKKSEKDILNYIIGLVKMNRELINYDLHIIVRDNGKEVLRLQTYKEGEHICITEQEHILQPIGQGIMMQ